MTGRNPAALCAATSALALCLCSAALSQPRRDADTVSASVNSGTTQRKDWITFDILLGVEQRGSSWEPYQTDANIGASSQIRFWEPWIWLDGTIVVSVAGETDAEGHRAGPGTSGVWLNNGVGTQWRIPGVGLVFFAGGGLSYVWASLTLPDKSSPPLPISEFLGREVYPDMDESASFWGGYVRAGATLGVTGLWHVGICAQGTLTTRRTILGRDRDMNTMSLSLLVGAGE